MSFIIGHNYPFPRTLEAVGVANRLDHIVPLIQGGDWQQKVLLSPAYLSLDQGASSLCDHLVAWLDYLQVAAAAAAFSLF